MFTCYLQGGLGNQLFQIITTIYHAKRTGNSVYFVDKAFSGDIYSGATVRNTYWHTLFSSLRPYLRGEYFAQSGQIKEYAYSYCALPQYPDKNRHYILVGYFQSYKYFLDAGLFHSVVNNVLNIHKHITVLRSKLRYMDGIYKQLSDARPRAHQPIIAMHVRRGDYTQLNHVYKILPPVYYERALNHILAQLPPMALDSTIPIARVIYLCEVSILPELCEMFDYLEQKFPMISFSVISPELTDWEQLLCMSICPFCVIANSTFSWWGAYLNRVNGAVNGEGHVPNRIYYPQDWFANDTPTHDLCPPHWVEVSCAT